MVALISLPYPIVTLFTVNKAQLRPRMPVIRCSIRVSSSLPSTRIRRRNYLRPKILKTLTKPYPTPIPDPLPEDLGTHIEPALEKSSFRVVEELEALVGDNEGGLGEIEVVRDTKGVNLMGSKGFSGQTMFKIVASFVGLFVLQTVVSVWIMDSGENGRRTGIEGRYMEESGLNGSVIVDELKIDEIRRMAREVREAEKRKRNMEKSDDVEDESDDDVEDFETDDSLRNDIAKEIDGRLTMLRKRSSMPMHNVNFLKKVGGSGKEVKKEDVDGKDEDNKLMFEAKRKFRSHMVELGDKPKGFEGINDVREKARNMNDAKPESSNKGMEKDKDKSVSQSSQGVKKRVASEEKNLGKGINGSSSLSNDSSINSLSKGINNGAKLENGVLQDSSNRNTFYEAAKLKESTAIKIQESQRKINDLVTSTSKMHAMQRITDSGKPTSKLSRGTSKDKKNNDDQDLWWLTLPYVYAILMQKGLGNEAQQGFYTLQSDAEYESSYTVAFEDQTDARNFSYILDSVFWDLPDAAVDVVLMSTKELKEIIESVNKNVVIARKGKLKLYAGQPLEDAESALRLLVK